MPKLTKRFVDSAKPETKDYFVFDEGLPGFALRVLPGGRKTYLVQYRSGGRTRRVNIGRHGTLTPDEARKRAKELLGLVAKGDNPAEEINTRRKSPTIKDVCDRFLREHVAHHCKLSTAKEYERSIGLFIAPAIGAFRVIDVKRSDIAKLHQGMGHIPYQANRTLGVLSKMFNLAEVWGLRPDGSNPCHHVKKYREDKRQRFLSAKEMAALGQAFEDELKENPESKAAIAAFKLLILTGCRRGEIQTLKWSYVNGNTITLPDSKTGPKIVYLGEAARKVLDGIEKTKGNEYVITGQVEKQHLTDLERPWRRIRARAGLDDVRIHDLRHTFASGALAIGEALPMIGKLLGHSQVQTTARYAHLADNPIRDSANRISGEIARALFGGNDNAPESPTQAQAENPGTGNSPYRANPPANENTVSRYGDSLGGSQNKTASVSTDKKSVPSMAQNPVPTIPGTGQIPVPGIAQSDVPRPSP